MFFKKDSKNRYLQCSNPQCNVIINIPQSGYYEVLNTKCLICGFTPFKFKTKKKRKTYIYYICPKCWSDGSEINPRKTFCSQCKKGKIERNNCIPLEEIK